MAREDATIYFCFSVKKKKALHSTLQVYEKWKEEHDNLLKEKFRKKKEKENKLKIKKEEQEEERKKDCKHAFSNW